MNQKLFQNSPVTRTAARVTPESLKGLLPAATQRLAKAPGVDGVATDPEIERLSVRGISCQCLHIKAGEFDLFLLDDSDFRLFSNAFGKPHATIERSLVLGPHLLALNLGALQHDELIFLKDALAHGMGVLAAHCACERGGYPKQERGAALYHHLAGAESDQALRAQLQFAFPDVDDDVLEKNLPRQLHRAYRPLKIDSVDQAIAPLNPEYWDWKSRFTQPPAKVFKQQYPEMAPKELSASHAQRFITSPRQRGIDLAKQWALRWSPLLVPRSAKVELAPYLRCAEEGKEPYFQYSLCWPGEWLGSRKDPLRTIKYVARFHTPTRENIGTPPSSVISRTVDGRSYRLLSPSRSLFSLSSKPEFEGLISRDASGNFWVSERRFDELTRKFGPDDARSERLLRAILRLSHHPFWDPALVPAPTVERTGNQAVA